MYFYGVVLPADADARRTPRTSTATLPDYESTRNEGFGKLTITPDQPGAAERQLPLLAPPRQGRHVRVRTSTATTGSGNEAWQKIGIAEGSWVINARSFATFKYTHFENPTQSRPDNVADVAIDTAIGHEARLEQPRQDRPVRRCRRPVAGAAAYNAFVQPLIDRYGYTLNGVKTGGGIGRATPRCSTRTTSIRDQAQVAYNLTLGSDIRHDIHAGHPVVRGLRGPDSQLERLGLDYGARRPPGRAPASTASRRTTSREFQQQSTGAVPPIHSEYQSLNIEVNDTINFNNLSFNVGLLMSYDKLYGQGLKEDSSTISGYVAGRREPVPDVQDPVRQDAAAARGRDLVVQRQGHRLRELRALHPGGQLAAARRVVGAQPGRHDQRATSTPTACSTACRTWPARRGKLFVPDMTPRRTDEYLVGTAKQFENGVTRRGPTTATARARTSGRTPTTTRGSASTRRRTSRGRSTSRTSPPS